MKLLGQTHLTQSEIDAAYRDHSVEGGLVILIALLGGLLGLIGLCMAVIS